MKLIPGILSVSLAVAGFATQPALAQMIIRPADDTAESSYSGSSSSENSSSESPSQAGAEAFGNGGNFAQATGNRSQASAPDAPDPALPVWDDSAVSVTGSDVVTQENAEQFTKEYGEGEDFFSSHGQSGAAATYDSSGGGGGGGGGGDTKAAVMKILKKNASEGGKDKNLFQKMLNAWEKGVTVTKPKGGQSTHCQKGALAFTIVGQPKIFMCNSALAKSEKDKEQILVHETVHVVGQSNECLATRIEQKAMKSVGKTPFQNGYAAQCGL